MVVSETKTRLTYKDYAKTPECERYELLDGELIMAAAPNMAHQRVGIRLGGEFHIYVVNTDAGEVYLAPTDVYLSDTDVVQPDLVFFSKKRSHIRTGMNIRGAPDIVVEILSPSTSTYDWGYKKDLYARHGVKEYWLADPYAKQIIVMLLQNDVFEIVGVYREDDILRSPTLEGFELDMGRIFDDVFDDILADVLDEMP